ncbi:MAG: hypothetical protein IJ688_04700 [Treponema sp.]|nr:hypothetical protein [Treponema sp.]
MKKNSSILFLIFFSFSVFAQMGKTDDKPNIVVANFKGNGVSAEDMKFVEELFIAEYPNTGVATVVDRGNLDKIMQETHFQEEDWSNPDKVETLGTILNAQQLLIGQFQRREKSDKIILIIKITAMTGGGIIASETAILKDIDELLQEGQNSVKSICERLAKKAGTDNVSLSGENKVNQKTALLKNKTEEKETLINEKKSQNNIKNGNETSDLTEKVWVEDPVPGGHTFGIVLTTISLIGGFGAGIPLLAVGLGSENPNLYVPGIILTAAGGIILIPWVVLLCTTENYGHYEERVISKIENNPILSHLAISPLGVNLTFKL